MNQNNDKKFGHLAAAFGGLLLGYGLHNYQVEESKKSRAERDNPHEAEAAAFDVAEILDAWEPYDSSETEEDFTQDLAEYLEENCDWEIEVFPNSPEGKPDILIGDLVALELKVGLNKSQRDRLLGQCAGYSRLWVTWAVIIGASESELGRLEDLLEDKGLENISVWGF